MPNRPTSVSTTVTLHSLSSEVMTHVSNRSISISTVAEPSNLMSLGSTYFSLDTKYSREDIKLHGSVERTPRENSKIHIFPPGSQMR